MTDQATVLTLRSQPTRGNLLVLQAELGDAPKGWLLVAPGRYVRVAAGDEPMILTVSDPKARLIEVESRASAS